MSSNDKSDFWRRHAALKLLLMVAVSAGFAFGVLHMVREGSIRSGGMYGSGDGSIISRDKNPFEFWGMVVFFGLMSFALPYFAVREFVRRNRSEK